MNSPRAVLSALAQAASALSAELPSRFERTEALQEAAEALDVALANAYEELNCSHQLVAFVEKGNITNVFSDVEMGMSCMILSWDTVGHDRNDPNLVEVTWTGTNCKSEPLLAIHEPCQVDPILVSDVTSAFDELRANTLATFQQMEKSRDA